MKTNLIILVTSLIIITSCNSSKILTQGKTYDNFRGFEPIDPIEYLEEVAIVENGEIVWKYPLKLKKDEILGFLANETVLVSVGQFSGEGSLGYGPASFSIKGSSYKITMDYMKFATLREKDLEGLLVGYKRVGVGLRIIANVTAMESGVNLGDLFAIGLAAKANKLSGTLMLEIIGIKSKDVTAVLPLPSEINQSTIQSAMQAMATIKSKIYEDGTELYPQVMAIKSEEGQNNSSFRAQVETKSLK
ncbi:MAG: hypothetical protein AB9834_05880 [Lentimicrobium sp.]